MESADKAEVVLLDGLNPTPRHDIPTPITLFHTFLDPHTSPPPPTAHLHPQGTIGEGGLRGRIQKIMTLIPPTIAQTHNRLSTFKPTRKNQQQQRQRQTTSAPTDSRSGADDASMVRLTDQQASAATSLPMTSSDLGLLAPEDHPSAPLLGHGPTFTVSRSLFAKVKAILHPSSTSSPAQSHAYPKHPTSDLDHHHPQQRQQHPSRGSSGSELDSGTSNSSGTLSESRHHVHHPHHPRQHHRDGSHSTVTTTTGQMDESSTTAFLLESKLRQRKYSFGSRHNSVAPADSNVALVGVEDDQESGDLDEDDNSSNHEETVERATAAAAAKAVEQDDSCRADHSWPPNEAKEQEEMGQDPVVLFHEVFGRQHQTEGQITESLHLLRQLILAYGIPDEPSTATAPPGQRSRAMPTIRSRCWKLLLEVNHVSAQEYISLVKRGKPDEYGKIRNDTFRTLATDKKFLDVVEEDSLIRILCAFAWSTHATLREETGISFTYVQGMNVLAAPFLYAMSEMEAFYAYSNFIKYCCPLYVQPTLQGVHWGIKLLEQCLCKIDVELYDYLKSKRLSAELYAFPSVLTICACTPPLDQAMQLWDFLLAWGIHLNIICIIAQLYLIRDDLMRNASPMKLLRIFPDLDADKIIRETIRMVKLLPDELYDLLVRHPFDPSVADEIGW